MKKSVIFFLLIIFSFPAFADEETLENPAATEIWDSDEGLARLERSRFKNDFYQLINFYQPQENPLYCSVATGVIILNALNYGNIASQKELEVVRPENAGGGIMRYPIYSQKTFFNKETDKIKKREIIDFREMTVINGKKTYDAGLSFDDFVKILSGPYKLKVKTIYAEKNNKESIDQFRDIIRRVLSDETSFIIVNFDGKILGKTTNGHISPLAAYDEESDSVLILDTALHKNKWYFSRVEDLYQAMNSKDEGRYRGYLIVRR
jgi:hypothetical protein